MATEELSETDVQLHVRERAAAFKSPHRVLFVAPEDVPRRQVVALAAHLSWWMAGAWSPAA